MSYLRIFPRLAVMLAVLFAPLTGAAIGAEPKAAAQGSWEETLREDIPKEPIPAAYRRRAGVDYVPMFLPARMDAAPIIKLFKETVKP